MYHALVWQFFIHASRHLNEIDEIELQHLHRLSKTSLKALSPLEDKIAVNRARRLADTYKNSIDEQCRGYNERYDEPDYYSPQVTYDETVYKMWMKAVRERHTVSMLYDSTTSSIKRRLVNPYQTRSPYGKGYCHLRQEVRQFRFDRIIDITLTEKTFDKPKNWDKL